MQSIIAFRSIIIIWPSSGVETFVIWPLLQYDHPTSWNIAFVTTFTMYIATCSYCNLASRTTFTIWPHSPIETLYLNHLYNMAIVRHSNLVYRTTFTIWPSLDIQTLYLEPLLQYDHLQTWKHCTWTTFTIWTISKCKHYVTVIVFSIEYYELAYTIIINVSFVISSMRLRCYNTTLAPYMQWL